MSDAALAPEPAGIDCRDCGTQVARALHACPACGSLVHRDALERLAGEAQAAEASGEAATAAARWRDALALLPADSRQRVAIEERLTRLAREAEESRAAAAAEAPKPRSPLGRVWAGIVAIALFALGKAKLLLFGLLKLKSLLSLGAFFGVYWGLYGWRWALGIVVVIYLHEVGHVVQLARYGVKATTMMFVPGLGAYVSWQQRLASVRQEAWVALAGPLWGLGAGLGAFALARVTKDPTISAIAQWAGFINLLNLLPIWIFDGASAFRALTRPQRLGMAVVLGFMAFHTGVVLVGIVGGVAALTAFVGTPAERPDRGVFLGFLALSAALGLLATTHTLPEVAPVIAR